MKADELSIKDGFTMPFLLISVLILILMALVVIDDALCHRVCESN